MTLYYNFDGDDYDFDLTYKQVREAVADICSSNKSDCDVIKQFIYATKQNGKPEANRLWKNVRQRSKHRKMI